MIGVCIFLYLASIFIVIYSSGWRSGFAVNEGFGKSSFSTIGLIIILTVFLYINLLFYTQFKDNSLTIGNWGEKIASELDSIKLSENEELKELVATRNMLAMKLIETNDAIKKAGMMVKGRKRTIKLPN